MLDLVLDKDDCIYSITGSYFLCANHHLKWRQGGVAEEDAAETAAETVIPFQRAELPFILHQVASVLFNWLFSQHSLKTGLVILDVFVSETPWGGLYLKDDQHPFSGNFQFQLLDPFKNLGCHTTASR